MQLKKHDQGLSLLELVIAIFVLSLGSMAALRATDQARVAIGGAPERTLAQLAADNRIETLKLMGSGAILPDRVMLAGQEFILVTVFETTLSGVLLANVTARGPNGAGAVVSAYLLPAR